jgi:hypothetical protein
MLGGLVVLKIYPDGPKVGMCEQMTAACNAGAPQGVVRRSFVASRFG